MDGAQRAPPETRKYNGNQIWRGSGASILFFQRDERIQVAQKGGKQSTKKGPCRCSHPERDIPVGTLKSVEKQSGLKLREEPCATMLVLSIRKPTATLAFSFPTF